MKIFRQPLLFLVVLTTIFFVSGFIKSGVVFAAVVNINTANATELDSIPEVGPATAAKIITYRETNGLFAKIEDIMNVSGIKQATFDKMKDFITVESESVSNSEDTATTTDEIATTTEETLATSTATTTATTTTTVTNYGGERVIYSTHYIQEDLSGYIEPTTFEVSAGRPRLAYLDLPIKFEAKHKVSKDLENRNCKYSWTFGDGFSQVGEKVEHIYKYVGDYNVVLNGSCSDLKSVSRTVVKVVAPSLSILTKLDGAVEVFNQGKYEMNLYGWKIKTQNQEYVFPMDTIISAGQKVTFPEEYLKIIVAGKQIILSDSSDKTVAQTGVNFTVSDPNKVISVADFKKFAVEYKKLTSRQSTILATAPSTAPTTSASEGHSSLEKAEKGEGENLVPLTASVASVPSFSFWSKLFHPVRTISEAFYK